MVEKGIRGRICHSIYKYAKLNNKYMKDYNKNEESPYIQYWDKQALSGDSQSTCCKMHAKILLGVPWCAMCIFLFLNFSNFIKGIMCI